MRCSIKLENLLMAYEGGTRIEQRGSLWVADFGTARCLSSAGYLQLESIQ